MNPTATRARDLALQRHRREVMKWQWVCIGWAVAFLVCLIKVILLQHATNSHEPQVWRTGLAPVGEPYWVTTQAFVRKKDRVWCSFSNGEPIEVSHWTTQQP